MTKAVGLRIITLLIFFSSTVFSFSTDLRPGNKECFIVTASLGVPLTGSFEIISGDPKDFVITVEGPPPRSMMHFESKFKEGVDSQKDISEGTFSFDAEVEGEHTMCIENSADGTKGTVAFNFRSIASGEQQDYEYIGLESELAELREGLHMLKDHQSYMSQREDVHTAALENINTKVLCWTVLEAAILIAMAIWQISYIRSFFETKRRL